MTRPFSLSFQWLLLVKVSIWYISIFQNNKGINFVGQFRMCTRKFDTFSVSLIPRITLENILSIFPLCARGRGRGRGAVGGGLKNFFGEGFDGKSQFLINFTSQLLFELLFTCRMKDTVSFVIFHSFYFV